MNVIETPDWETFQQKIRELRQEYQDSSSTLLFRGQGNSAWPLTTTLERNDAGRMLFREYYQLICGSMGPEVKTFAAFNVPDFDPKCCEAFLKDKSLLTEIGDIFPMPLYRYMVYLRHCGFPSPLLDWSRSPFVAVFFAFRDNPSSDKPKTRSIFAYCERPKRVGGATLGQPQIRQMGPYIESHQRHFRQRCDYTICGNFDENYGWRFDSHQAVFDRKSPMQDFLWRFDLPSDQWEKVLRSQDDYNLNAFSLFGSEESLLETLWFREHVLRKPY